MKIKLFQGLLAFAVVLMLTVGCSSTPSQQADTTSVDSGSTAGVTVKPVTPAQDDTELAQPTSIVDVDSEFEPVPVVDLVWFDGTPGSTADLVGTPTIINFWASNCPPCVAEMPAFEEVFQALDGSVEFVGINVADSSEQASELAERTGVTYPLAEDPDSAVFRSFGGFVMPTTVFLNANGEVAYVWAGALGSDELRILIDTHILPGSL